MLVYLGSVSPGAQQPSVSSVQISAYPDLATNLHQILILPTFKSLLCQKREFTIQPST